MLLFWGALLKPAFLRYYKARLISNSVVSSACVGSCTRLLMHLCTRINSKSNICVVFALLPSPPVKVSWVVGFSLKVIRRNNRFGLEWLRKQSAVYIMRGRLWGIWGCEVTENMMIKTASESQIVLFCLFVCFSSVVNIIQVLLMFIFSWYPHSADPLQVMCW